MKKKSTSKQTHPSVLELAQYLCMQWGFSAETATALAKKAGPGEADCHRSVEKLAIRRRFELNHSALMALVEDKTWTKVRDYLPDATEVVAAARQNAERSVDLPTYSTPKDFVQWQESHVLRVMAWSVLVDLYGNAARKLTKTARALTPSVNVDELLNSASCRIAEDAGRCKKFMKAANPEAHLIIYAKRIAQEVQRREMRKDRLAISKAAKAKAKIALATILERLRHGVKNTLKHHRRQLQGAAICAVLDEVLMDLTAAETDCVRNALRYQRSAVEQASHLPRWSDARVRELFLRLADRLRYSDSGNDHSHAPPVDQLSQPTEMSVLFRHSATDTLIDRAMVSVPHTELRRNRKIMLRPVLIIRRNHEAGESFDAERASSFRQLAQYFSAGEETVRRWNSRAEELMGEHVKSWISADPILCGEFGLERQPPKNAPKVVRLAVMLGASLRINLAAQRSEGDVSDYQQLALVSWWRDRQYACTRESFPEDLVGVSNSQRSEVAAKAAAVWEGLVNAVIHGRPSSSIDEFPSRVQAWIRRVWDETPAKAIRGADIDDFLRSAEWKRTDLRVDISEK